MRLKLHVAVMLAVVVTAVFTIANLVPALASDHEDETTIQYVIPDLYDQKADVSDPNYFKVGNAMTECNQLGYDYGFKKNDPTFDNGSGIGDGMSIDYSFDGGNQGTTLEWNSNLGIDAVILKASTKANVYKYDPEATEDAGLRTPVRVSKKGDKQYYGISHVTFCWDRELLVEKTAEVEFTREYFWGITKSVSPEGHDLFDGDSAESTWVIDVEKSGYEDRDFLVSGDITVSNPWTATANNVVVTDQLASAVVDCGTFSGQLATGDSVECGYVAQITNEALLPSVNIATATADGFQIQSATVAIAKGDPSIEVNAEVAVDDDSNDAGDRSGISGDDSWTYTETFTCAIDEGSHNNVVVVTGNAGVVLGSDQASVQVNCYTPSITKAAGDLAFVRTSDWTIDKSVSLETHDLFDGESADSIWQISVDETETDSDFVATGTITIYNPNPSQALAVTISDTGTSADGVELVASPAVGNTAGASSVVWTREDANSTVVGAILNNTASFNLFGIGYSNYANYSYSLGDATFVNPEVAVDDDSNDAGDRSGISGDDSWTYTETFTCAIDEGSHNNVAVVTGNAGVVLGNDQASVQVNCYTPSITKTLTSTDYTRTFDWDIAKTVSVSEHNLITGGVAGISEYEISVTKNGGTDSDYSAVGSIIITNPHPGAVLTATLIDTEAESLSTQSINVLPGGSQTIVWEANDPDASGNTASFSLFGTEYTSRVSYSYGAPTVLVNDSVAVSDSNSAFAGPKTTSSDAIWIYPVSFTCDSDEGENLNTASFSGDTDLGSASASVLVNCEDGSTGSGSGHDTAFMFGEVPYCDTTPRWGWTEQVDSGEKTYPIYAGAGQCDITKGPGIVGHVSVDGEQGQIIFQLDSGWVLSGIGELHVNVSDTPVTPNNNGGFSGNSYVIVNPGLNGGTYLHSDATGIVSLVGKWIIVHMAVVN